MRIATWNVNSVTVRLPRLLDWLETRAPDVVLLQETKCAEDAFPAMPVMGLGYDVAAHGLGAWNGVAILSKVGLTDVRRGFEGDPGYPTPDVREARAMSAVCGGVRVWSVYVPNGRAPDSDHYAYKLAWLSSLERTVAADLTDSSDEGASQVVVAGDFNVAPTDDDVWNPRAFIGSTHVTPPERDALARIRDLGLYDVVPRPGKGTHPFTYWDYRAGMFHRDEGMRIDLFYASRQIKERVDDAHVDREARKGKLPSDHAPVIVDLT